MACDVFITELRSIGNGSHAEVKEKLYSNLKRGLEVLSTVDQGGLLMRKLLLVQYRAEYTADPIAGHRRKRLEHAMVGLFNSN
jgi:hypothetical protein